MKSWVAQQTVKTAKSSKYPVFRHGAIFESGGRILFKSRNVKKSNTPSASMSVHAEVAGLKAILSKTRLHKKTVINLYVARVSPKDQVMLSKPCEKCMAAIEASGIIDQIYYSDSNGQWQKLV
jgi:tRNA(Arg) A34 adenosine deaminase TadA